MGVTSNKPNGCICWLGGNPALATPIRSFNKISGDEPTIVMVPPKIAQKPIGINKRDSDISVLTDIRLATGKKSAAAPTFCIKDEITPTEPDIMGIIRRSVLPPIFKMYPATFDINPVLSRPAPMIIIAIIEITALDAKPSNNVEGSARLCKPGNWLKRPKVTIARMAVRSMRKASVTKRKTVTPRTAKTTTISVVSNIGSIVVILIILRLKSTTRVPRHFQLKGVI